ERRAGIRLGYRGLGRAPQSRRGPAGRLPHRQRPVAVLLRPPGRPGAAAPGHRPRARLHEHHLAAAAALSSFETNRPPLLLPISPATAMMGPSECGWAHHARRPRPARAGSGFIVLAGLWPRGGGEL